MGSGFKLRSIGCGRRRFMAVLAGVLLVPQGRRRVYAEDVEVPIPLQIELTARVVKYDRNAADRMGATCNVLVLRRKGDTASAQAATQARTELGKLDDIAGKPIHVAEHEYVDTETLVRRCSDDGIGLLLLTPGFSDTVPALAAALSDKNLLTVSLLGNDVPTGIVLGFVLESSRPTIVVHLAQARRQNVDFSARLLAIAKVVG